MTSLTLVALLLAPLTVLANSGELALPPLQPGPPAAGKRVAVTVPEYVGTDVHHMLYLPPDWQADWKSQGRCWPVIVEYTGNKAPTLGSSGRVEDAALGFGISAGRFIWLTLPYVNKSHNQNELTWWGDEEATVAYAKTNVPRICAEFGGDPQTVFLCGFSRGAIGVNYIGLYDDDIARLWCGLISHDHYDGVKEWKGTAWGSPLDRYRAGAADRLRRLKGRPVLVCQNGGTQGIEEYLNGRLSLAEFTFLNVDTSAILGDFPNALAIHPHTDRWLLKDSLARRQVWAWVDSALRRSSGTARRSAVPSGPSKKPTLIPAGWDPVVAAAAAAVDAPALRRNSPSAVHQELQQRIDRVLDRWCRWLSGYVRPVPGTDLYTISPKQKQSGHPYRNVAGNQFAAAAAAYWLARANPEEPVARPLRGLVKLSLVSHMAVPPIEHPLVLKWGARGNVWGGDDWHADLFAGTSGMLMLPGLPPAESEQLLKILAWEADWQIEVGVGKGRTLPRLGGSSVGESNAWSTALIQSARVALPHSARQAAWQEAAIQYSLNSICVPDDATSDKVIGGKPLKDRVKGANFEPGGIQEHHGFYHPGYMGWALALQAYAQMMDEMLPEAERNPDVYLHNWRLAFDRLKQGIFSNGRFIHCAGDDWNAYGYGNDHILPIGVYAGAKFRDPDAVRLASEWLALAERQQAITGGPIQGSRLSRLQHDYHNDFAWYESISGATLACALWVLEHADTSAMPPAATEEQYNARNMGTYYEPDARLVWCRDRHRWASCSWRSAYGEWQAIVQPIALPHLLKFNHNSTGILQVAGGFATKRILASNTSPLEGGFWSLGTIERAATATRQGKPLVRQHQALVALPEVPSVFVDLCEALESIEVEQNLGLGLRLAADVFNDHQMHLEAGGKERTFPPHPQHDTWHDLEARSVTIERLLTIHALTGDGSFHLMQKRRRAPDFSESIYSADSAAVEESLLGHELYFGPPIGGPPRKVSAGQWFRQIVLVSYCDPRQTPSRPSGSVTGESPCLVVDLPDVRRTVAINFTDREAAAGPAKVGSRSVVILTR